MTKERLDIEKINQIFLLYKKGYNSPKIARELGVSETVVRKRIRMAKVLALKVHE